MFHTQAQWIWGSGAASPRNEWRCFRRTFQASASGWDQATIALAADSRYVLYINGTFVGRGAARSWPEEQAYDRYEVGHLLRAGQANTIAVIVIHYGVSTFSYVRGRGGLLVQLQLEAESAPAVQAVYSDESWRTAVHGGYDKRTQRMSCQLGFAERIDARLWDERWTQPDYDDASWELCNAIGTAGMLPWASLVQSDIPPLTEECVHPSRIESLSRVKPIAWTAKVDVRNHMVPDSADHANRVRYAGFIATVIRVVSRTVAVLGFPDAVANFGDCYLNGRHIAAAAFYGPLPERYVEVELQEGDNLFLMDVSGEDHGHGFRMGIDSPLPVEVWSPMATGADCSPFLSIGPFEAFECNDYDMNPDLSRSHPAFREAPGFMTIEQLMRRKEWLQPIHSSLVSRDDVTVLSMWKREAVPQAVSSQLHHAVIAHAVPARVPRYEDGDTEIIIDFGRMLSGYLTFEVAAATGTELDFYGFEFMLDGRRQDAYALDNTLRYTCREGRQTYTSPVRRGLRYLMVTVRGAMADVKLYQVRMIQSNFPVAEIGRFACSDALLGHIWQISRHTVRLCMEDTFVDCPTYEQTYWVGDSRNAALSGYALFGAEALVRRCLRLVPGSAKQTMLYMDQVPSGWKSVIPNWTFFWVMACNEHYRHTGDDAFAREIWPHMQATLIRYLEHRNEQGLFYFRGWNLLDWAPIDQPNDGVVAHQNAFLARALREAAQLAGEIGEAQGGRDLIEAAAALEQAINLHLWSEKRQAYIDCIHADGSRSEVCSMQTQIAAYICDVAQEERRARIERLLQVTDPNFVQIGSPFMSFFYYEALAASGAYEQILADIRNNYGVMLEYDATTCWETYPNYLDRRPNPNQLTRSHCHAWSAAPAYFLPSVVLGVKAAGIGGKAYRVEPQPCGLAWARGSVPVPGGGRIDVSWRMEGERRMQLRIAVMASAHISVSACLPAGMEGEIEWQ